MAIRFVHPEKKVIDFPYIVFTTKYGIDFTTGAKIEANLKACLMYVNAEPTLEEATITIDKQPVKVWLPCILLRGTEAAGTQDQLIRVVYDQHYIAPFGDLEATRALIAEATRRSNTYNPLYRE